MSSNINFGILIFAGELLLIRKVVVTLEITALDIQQEKILLNALFDFVIRVSDFHSDRSPEEINVLPAMTKILYDYGVEQSF